MQIFLRTPFNLFLVNFFLFILHKKRKKTRGFLTFSVGIEMEHWPEIGYIWEYPTANPSHLQFTFPEGSFISYVHKDVRKTNISDPLIRTPTCAYHAGRNVGFSGNFTSVLNEWSVDAYNIDGDGQSMFLKELISVFSCELVRSWYLLVNVTNGKTRTIREIFSKLTIKTPEPTIVNFQYTSFIVLVFSLLTLNKKNTGWEITDKKIKILLLSIHKYFSCWLNFKTIVTSTCFISPIKSN